MIARFLLIVVLATSVQAAIPVDSTLQQRIYFARDRVMPALVHIQPVIKNYDTGELEKQAVIGSGIIFHEDGYVVTNYHVAGKAERIICTLDDREQVPATFIGGDPMTDIAVLKLDLSDYKKPLHVADFGNSDSAQVGQYVLAMGSPLSLSRSVSAGVISTKDRYFGSEVRLPSGERTGRYNLWLQTDAAINPGNSGGPLVDLSGRVVGINSRATMFANNIGFAIPINIVRSVTAAILQDGEVVRSWIGLHCQALQELEGYFNAGRDNGVLIASIDPGSPAEAAFLKAGDIILEINGDPVSARFFEEVPPFYSKIASFAPGTEITLKVLRGEEEYPVKVVTRQLGDLQGEDFEAAKWGFTVKAITRQMQIDQSLEDTLGVLVTGVKRSGSAGGLDGLRRGDVVVKINNTPVKGLAVFASKYTEIGDAERVMIQTNRNGAIRYMVLKIDDEEKVDD